MFEWRVQFNIVFFSSSFSRKEQWLRDCISTSSPKETPNENYKNIAAGSEDSASNLMRSVFCVFACLRVTGRAEQRKTIIITFHSLNRMDRSVCWMANWLSIKRPKSSCQRTIWKWKMVHTLQTIASHFISFVRLCISFTFQFKVCYFIWLAFYSGHNSSFNLVFYFHFLATFTANCLFIPYL